MPEQKVISLTLITEIGIKSFCIKAKSFNKSTRNRYVNIFKTSKMFSEYIKR